MNKKPLWYAIYTKPRWEKKVADLLDRKGIEQYCPLNKSVKQWSDRKKIVLEPLFTSYVFIRITADELTSVRETNGVINLVYWLGKPAVIKDNEIESIRRFMNDYHDVQLEKISVNVSDRVYITSGPFMNQQGEVVESTNKYVKVQLPSLGYALVAQIEKSNVKLVPIKSKVYNQESIAI